MPGAMIINLSNMTSKYATTKPHYTLIALVFLIIFLIFAERFINLNNLVSVIVLLLIFSIIIGFIFLDAHGQYEEINKIFNSSGGKNFVALFLLVFFIIFIYEYGVYGNNDRYALLDKLTFGHNKYVSNRFVGITAIFLFATVTAYTIYTTTRD
jgi:hypothetical protein